MDKILIKNAIVSEKVYFIDNEDEDYPMKGRVKILNFEQFKINNQDFEDVSSTELTEYKIGKLDLEYTNLSFKEDSCITSYFHILDSNGSKFEEIHDDDLEEAIANHLKKPKWYVWEDGNKTFIPKIKTKMKIFYNLPDKDTEYYLGVEECKIEEI